MTYYSSEAVEDSCVQGDNLFGSLGKREVFLILFNPRYSITTLSSPTPAPPCGGAPYLKASMYD